MDLTGLIITTVAISVSGVMSPGPLTASAIMVGARGSEKGGLLIALGHTIFEFPYILIIAMLYSSVIVLLENSIVNFALTVAISAFIFFFSYLTIRDGISVLRLKREFKGGRGGYAYNPLLIGLLLTGLNPYFLLWWLSVGMPLIRMSMSMGLQVLLVMYAAHVWMDYFWLALMSLAGEGSVKILRSRGYGALLVALGIILILFGLDICLKTFLNFRLLPI